MKYSIEEHKHRFSSWAASRGASTSPNCRFTVEVGKRILENSSLRRVINSVENLPKRIDFDKQHRIWRNEIINIAKNYNIIFTHGVAAKLVNLYLKSIFISAEDISNDKIKAIHPPIDSILLEALYKNNVGNQKDIWKMARKARWSNFTSDEYEQVIQAIQISLNKEQGLWEIEQYWQGYQ